MTFLPLFFHINAKPGYGRFPKAQKYAKIKNNGRFCDMKKMMCAILTTLMLSGCFGSSQTKGEPIEVSAREVVDRLQNQKKDSFLLYITTDNCYSCDEYKKVIEELQDIKPFDIYELHINLKEEDEDVKEALSELEVVIGDYTAFPMTYYFYKGNLQPENIKAGYIEKGDYEKWLKDLRIL